MRADLSPLFPRLNERTFWLIVIARGPKRHGSLGNLRPSDSLLSNHNTSETKPADLPTMHAAPNFHPLCHLVNPGAHRAPTPY